MFVELAERRERGTVYDFLSCRRRTQGFTALGILVLAQSLAIAQRGEWGWMGGSSTEPASGSGYSGGYGTYRVPALANFPGSRRNAASATDSKGNLWLFGGYGFDAVGGVGILNDLWVYQPSDQEWTWMGGSSTVPTNYSGQAGVYGTLGTPASSNHPGGHSSATSWTDGSGHFWLFGGFSVDANGMAGSLNDLWEFNPDTNEWTWMAGPNSAGVDGANRGIYGTLGVPATSNTPGSRSGANGWADKAGHLWLFGGWGWDANGTNGWLNDLWEFDTGTKEWTWVGGSSVIYGLGIGLQGRAGIYGTLGVSNATNVPGSRTNAAQWRDASGNFWLFGGEGFDSTGHFGFLNDLWEFETSTQQWVWEGGADVLTLTSGGYPAEPGIYGTQGSPSQSNIAGSRSGAVSWIDSSGRLWLFGGYGFDSGGTNGWLNDLWQFDTKTDEWTWMSGSETLPTSLAAAPGSYGTFGIPEANNVPGGRSPAAGWTDENGNIWLFGGADANANSDPGDLDDLWEYLPPSFKLAANPGSLSLHFGAKGTVTLTVNPQSGFSAPVSFACSGLPAGATCAFSPTTVTPSGGSATTTLTLTAPATSSAMRPLGRPLLTATSLALVVGIFGWKQRRNTFTWLLVLGACADLGMMTACGGGGSSSGGGGGGSKTITATVTVTAASGSLQQMASFTLAVN